MANLILKQQSRYHYLVIVCLLALLALFSGLMFIDPAEAAPAETSGATYPVTVNTAGITQTTTFDSKLWNYSGNDRATAEIWYFIDQGTTNTTTLKLQASPDNSNWVDVVTFLSANVADTQGYTTTTIVGRYTRVVATLGNANLITPTIKFIYK